MLIRRGRSYQPIGAFSSSPSAFLAAVLSFAAGVLIYLPTLSFRFLWDDTEFILNNPFLRDPSGLWTVFHRFFASDVAPILGGARPLWVASLVWDHWLWGLNPAGYHLTNALLHGANSALAAALAFRLLNRPWAALALGLAFALHPVHAETVAAVGFRTDLLCLLFVQISALAFWRAFPATPEEPSSPPMRAGFYAVSLSAFGAALLAKEMAAPLPAALWVWDFFRISGKRLLKRSLLILPFLLVLSLYGYQRQRRSGYDLSQSVSFARLLAPLESLAGGATVPVRAEAGPSGPEAVPAAGAVYKHAAVNAATMLPVFARYVGNLLWPFALCPDYDVPVRARLSSPGVLAAGALLAAGLVLLWRGRRSSPVFSWGLAWFFLFLAPVSNVIPVANLMADRYLYVPSLGFLLAAAAAVQWGAERLDALSERIRGRFRRGTLALAAALGLAWTGQTLAYSRVWRDSWTLFSRATECAPANFRPWYNLGLAYEREGQWEKAVSHYRQAAERGPHRSEIYVNMGHCYERLQNDPAAEAAYRQALRANPRDPLAHFNLGLLASREGRWGEAEERLRAAMGFSPRFSRAGLELGNVFFAQKKWGEALDRYLEVVVWEPSWDEALYLAGKTYEAQGHKNAALQIWKRFLERHPRSPRRAEVEAKLAASR